MIYVPESRASVNHIVIKTMGQKDKTSIIILSILLISSLVGTAVEFSYFQKERLKVIALNAELENVKAEKRIAEDELAESKEKISELSVQLESARSEIDEVNKALEGAEAQKQQLYSQIDELQLQIQEQEEIKKEWKIKQIQTEEQIETLQATLQSLQASKAELETELNKFKAKDAVALGKIVVEQKKADQEGVEGATQEEVVEQAPSAASPQSQATPALEGRVLTVKKKFDFAVINLGSQDGIKVGDVFSVYHNHSYIGDIRAQRVRQTTSACSFTTKKVRAAIREGDAVALGKIVVEQKKADQEGVEGATQEEVVEQAPSAASPQSQATPALEGRVLTVKKKFDFAVINLGSQDGIKVGDVFSVYHNHSYIGDIRVDKSSEVMGVCVFASRGVKDKIREGDKVVRR